jgi:hypothetical protein
MRKSLALAAVAAAVLSIAAAACTSPAPTEARTPSGAHRDETDTTKKCNGMIGSGTAWC